MSRLFLLHFPFRAETPPIRTVPKGGPGRVEKIQRHFFMIHDQQATLIGRPREGKEMHAIVIIPRLLHLVAPVIGGIRLPGGSPVTDRVAPGIQHPGGVPLRDRHPIERHVSLRRQWRKTDSRHGRRCPLGRRGIATGHRNGKEAGHRSPQASLQQFATARQCRAPAVPLHRLIILGFQGIYTLLFIHDRSP